MSIILKKDSYINTLTLKVIPFSKPNIERYKILNINDNSFTIKWELSFSVKDVHKYALGVYPMGGSIDDPSCYMWQVLDIPKNIKTITYGKKPIDAVETTGSAKKLTRGSYVFYLFAYNKEHPSFDSDRDIVGIATAIIILAD